MVVFLNVRWVNVSSVLEVRRTLRAPSVAEFIFFQRDNQGLGHLVIGQLHDSFSLILLLKMSGKIS